MIIMMMIGGRRRDAIGFRKRPYSSEQGDDPAARFCF
jgi:hypothetical protein